MLFKYMSDFHLTIIVQKDKRTKGLKSGTSAFKNAKRNIKQEDADLWKDIGC